MSPWNHERPIAAARRASSSQHPGNGVKALRCRSRLLQAILVPVIALGALAYSASAALQFDVFLGYDGIVPEASWFPVVCEIKNDGPSFTGTVEVTGDFNNTQARRLVVELPTGTTKRIVIPVFSSSRGYGNRWEVRLLDERGRVRAEQPGLQPRRQVARGTPLLGALSRTPGGTPVIRPVLVQQADLQPATARFLPSVFPDNPLALEGLDCLYLNSERAVDLNVNQVAAILAWLHAGGHLIIAVEQPSDVTASPWLKGLFPCEPKDLQTVSHHPELQEWLPTSSGPSNRTYSAEVPQSQGDRLRWTDLADDNFENPFGPDKLPNDFDFEAAGIQVAVGPLREGTVEVAAGDIPLIVTTPRGRGRVTALLFSPEREPVRSWKNLPTFWARLTEVPRIWYVSGDFNRAGHMSSDGIFGAIIDSRQVHKLPVEWLLVLLLIYLVVIGPLDQYWLKRIGKPMLTWITFPCYVVLFSLVIYFIGYKLRAGESEWNDLHIVDVLAKGEGAELRGRTYSSVYSPANQRYLLESQQKYAAFRSEFQLYGGQSNDRGSVEQTGDGFKAEIFVPVWTSQLFVSDWWQSAPMPVSIAVRAQGEGWQVQLDNRSDRALTNLQMVIDDRIIALGGLAPKERRTSTLSREQGMPLREYVNLHATQFQTAVSARQSALGSTERGQLSDAFNSAVAASFLGQFSRRQGYQSGFVSPPGLDLTPVVERGGAVLLAWAADYSPVKPTYQFTPRRSHKNTLWRVVVPVQ